MLSGFELPPSHKTYWLTRSMVPAQLSITLFRQLGCRKSHDEEIWVKSGRDGPSIEDFDN